MAPNVRMQHIPYEPASPSLVPEFVSAAEFLSSTAVQANGLTEEQGRQYKLALVKTMETIYARSWHPDQPLRGSGNRCIRFHSRVVDPLLQQSADVCGFSAAKIVACFPKDLVFWVDPGCVCYKTNEYCPPRYVYESSEEKMTNASRNAPKQTGAMFFGARNSAAPARNAASFMYVPISSVA